MKKFLCLLVALVLVGSIALAEAIDLSSMTDDDLLALKDQISQVISDRGLIKEFYLTSGVYVGGADIKPGRYNLTAGEGNKDVTIGLGKDQNTLSKDEGILFYDYEYFASGSEPKTYSLSISEGNVLVIKADGELKLEKAEMIG